MKCKSEQIHTKVSWMSCMRVSKMCGLVCMGVKFLNVKGHFDLRNKHHESILACLQTRRLCAIKISRAP